MNWQGIRLGGLSIGETPKPQSPETQKPQLKLKWDEYKSLTNQKLNFENAQCLLWLSRSRILWGLSPAPRLTSWSSFPRLPSQRGDNLWLVAEQDPHQCDAPLGQGCCSGGSWRMSPKWHGLWRTWTRCQQWDYPEFSGSQRLDRESQQPRLRLCPVNFYGYATSRMNPLKGSAPLWCKYQVWAFIP